MELKYYSWAPVRTQIRAVVSGGAGGALAPLEFGSSVNPEYSNQSTVIWIV